MGRFLMPSLGADMEDGLLVEWERRPGDTVARGDVIAVVETQKGAIEIEVFENGVLESILVEPGTSVPVGTPLALIREDGGTEASSCRAEPVTLPKGLVDGAGTPVAPRRRVSPAARRQARLRGVGLEGLAGSGPAGAIVLADVEAAVSDAARGAGTPTSARTTQGDVPKAVSSGPESAARSTARLPSGMRDAIGAAMTRSKRDIPHYYLAHSADLTAITAWLARRNADRSPDRRVPMAALFVAAVARAARRHPRFNGHWSDGAFRPGGGVHVGMAIRVRGADGGLVAPALHEADRDDPETLSSRLRDLVERVRAGRFRLAELADPTLTVSSVGERGVETLYGVINPPQVCLVGIGAPHVAPRVRAGVVVPASVIAITLAADHRVTDGHAGSRFLAEIARRLEQPEASFEEMD